MPFDLSKGGTDGGQNPGDRAQPKETKSSSSSFNLSKDGSAAPPPRKTEGSVVSDSTASSRTPEVPVVAATAARAARSSATDSRSSAPVSNTAKTAERSGASADNAVKGGHKTTQGSAHTESGRSGGKLAAAALVVALVGGLLYLNRSKSPEATDSSPTQPVAEGSSNGPETSPPAADPAGAGATAQAGATNDSLGNATSANGSASGETAPGSAPAGGTAANRSTGGGTTVAGSTADPTASGGSGNKTDVRSVGQSTNSATGRGEASTSATRGAANSDGKSTVAASPRTEPNRAGVGSTAATVAGGTEGADGTVSPRARFDMGAPTKRGEQLVLAYFTRNSSELADPWAEGVQQLLEWLSANPNAKVTLEGFASSEGLASRNLALSEQRAVAMKQYLMSRGAAAERIQTSGAGTSNPLASNATADGRAKNRRVEVRF